MARGRSRVLWVQRSTSETIFGANPVRRWRPRSSCRPSDLGESGASYHAFSWRTRNVHAFNESRPLALAAAGAEANDAVGWDLWAISEAALRAGSQPPEKNHCIAYSDLPAGRFKPSPNAEALRPGRKRPARRQNRAKPCARFWHGFGASLPTWSVTLVT